MLRHPLPSPVRRIQPIGQSSSLRAGLRAGAVWSGFLAVLLVPSFPLSVAARPLHLNDPDYLVEVWETEDELPDDTVTALAQTPDGYLWIGSPSGLTRFDGFQFTRFSPETHPGFPAGPVRRLSVDSSGRLWVGTEEGLGYRQAGRFSSVPGFKGPVASISEHAGSTWVCLKDGNGYGFRGEAPVPLQPAPPHGLLALVNEIGGGPGPWAVTATTLHRWTNETWRPWSPLPETRFIGAAPAQSGGLWLASPTALRLLRGADIERQILRKPGTDEALELLEDSRGHLWSAGAASGLIRHSVSGVDRVFASSGGPFRFPVQAMVEDREGGLWFGTRGGGVVRLKPRRFQSWTGPASGFLPRLLEATPGSRWRPNAKDGAPLRLASGAHLTTAALEAVPEATCAWAGTNAQLWAGSREGLFRVAPDGTATAFPLPVEGPVEIHDLASVNDGELVVATARGIFVIRGDTAVAVEAPAGVNGASGLLEQDGSLLVAALPRGFFRLGNGQWTAADPSAQPFTDQVTAMAAGADGRVWFSGPNRRLAVLHQGTVQPVPDSVLPDVEAFSALAVDAVGSLWLGSDDGLYRIGLEDLGRSAPAPDETPRWTRFDTRDGLAGTKIHALAPVPGAQGNRPLLLVATQKGLSVADPAAIRVKSQASRPVIESLVSYEPKDTSDSNHQIEPELGAVLLKAVNEHAVVLPLGPKTAVPKNAHRVEARFTAVNFDAPDRVRFRYRLLGLQEEWTELASNCPIPFHSLPPGQFTFQVKASNSDGVWGEEVASVGFVIRPEFWQTGWFRALLGLGALGALAAFGWSHNHSRNRRHDQLVEQQRHLAREKARLASVLETTSDVVAFADPDLRIFYLNPAGCRTLEVSAPSLERSLPFDSILAADSITRFHEEAAPAAILRGVWSGEMVLQADNAKPLYVSQVMLCHKHPDGSVDFFSFVMRDLSPIKEAEARHEKLEAQLRQAQKMEAVGLLAGGVAHDFNNILQVILGHSSIALEKEVPPADRENSLIEVKKAAKRAAQLTKQLLAFGRRQPLQKLHFDVNTLVREALDMSRRLLGADIEIEFRPADDQAVIYADRGQIEQVLMNLCVNARDAMPRGGKLKIEIAQLGSSASDNDTSVIGPLPAGPCVRISVSDTGVGISPENLPHIFEPFFTTKPKNKGSGLGLSVVYGIIQQHGGNLRIDSKLGVGTTFHVYLPASPGTATVQRVTRELPVKRGSGTILVAEDEEAVRLLATRILQKAGYTVLAARDGEEAVSLFRENNESVDLLLMDVIMPRLSGPEAVKQIRELDPEIPALYASGYGGEFLRADGRLDIEGEVLQKPYQPSELLDRISGYLSNTKR